MRILEYIVPAELSGSTVKTVLRSALQLSSSLVKTLKWREGAITRNGANVHVNAIVQAGDLVCVALAERAEKPFDAKPCGIPLDITYEDEDLLVLNKPAGLAMHPSSTDLAAPNLAGALVSYLGPGSVPHFVSRLDKGTSGLLIAAKTGYVHELLRRALHTDALWREYRAVAMGHVEPPQGSIDLPIGRAEGSIIRRCVCEDGDAAHTDYEVLAYHGCFTLLQLRPRTGRTHQLRVHMAAIGYPLAGDWLYGTEDKSLISRPALHSFFLRFTHTVTGVELSFTAPLPEDMTALLTSSRAQPPILHSTEAHHGKYP